MPADYINDFSLTEVFSIASWLDHNATVGT